MTPGLLNVMIFIDLSWLFVNDREIVGPEARLSYASLEWVLASQLQKLVSGTQFSIAPYVYICGKFMYFGHPAQYDPMDHADANRRFDFLETLEKKYHFVVNVYDQDFAGQRLRRADRGNTHRPIKEKQVDVAMAVDMLDKAWDNQFQVAIVVAGDLDFAPALKKVRERGKQVMLASIRTSCHRFLSDPDDPLKIRDFPVVWLNDFREDLIYGKVRKFNLANHALVR